MYVEDPVYRYYDDQVQPGPRSFTRCGLDLYRAEPMR